MKLKTTIASLLAASLTAVSLTACSDPVDVEAMANAGLDMNIDPDRVRSTPNPELVAMVPDDISADGKLTAGMSAHPSPPLGYRASDNSTVLGLERDIVQLIADKLDLEVEAVPMAWDAWPLRLGSKDIEIFQGNVAVINERLDTLDLSTNRAAYLAFQSRNDGTPPLNAIKDMSGQKVAVIAGTNQDRLLQAWNEELESQGMDPMEISFYANGADYVLAMKAGRVDYALNQYPGARYMSTVDPELTLAGVWSAGWPDDTLVGTATLRGNGLAPAITAAMNELITEGTYQQVLEHWELGDEAITVSETYSREEYGDKHSL